MSTQATATKTACHCGCGEQIGPKATYRPGHDARHAGMVARATIAADPKQEKTLLLALPSPALRAKAQRAVARATAKPAEKAEADK